MNNTVAVCLHGTRWVSSANRVVVFHDELKLIPERLLTVKPQQGTDSLILSVRDKAACSLSLSLSLMSLTPLSKRGPNNMATQIFMKLLAVWRAEFFNGFAGAGNWTRSWARWIQPMPSYSMNQESFQYYLHICSHIFQVVLFPLAVVCIYHSNHAC